MTQYVISINFLKLFDTHIQPKLDYGANMWGLETTRTLTEIIHPFANKTVLKNGVLKVRR